MNANDKPENRSTNSCRGCTLLCDDVNIELSSADKLQFARVCNKGEAWYRSRLEQKPNLQTIVNGMEASWNGAAQAVAKILQSSRAPVFAGMEWLDTRSQQAVMELVRKTGGFVSPTVEEFHPAGLTALQKYGRATCTLGEPGLHPGLVCFWNVEPEEVPPRLVERHFQNATGIWNVSTRESVYGRTQTVYGPTATTVVANREMQLEFIRKIRTRGATSAGGLAVWKPLFEQIQQARHIVFLIGQNKNGLSGPDPVIDGLHQMTRILNASVPCVILELGSVANSVSACEVTGWSTGQFSTYQSVCGSGGSIPADRSLRDRMVAGDYDVAIAFEPQQFDSHVAEALTDRGQRKLVCLGSGFGPLTDKADVTVSIGETGWDLAGDFFRLDGIPVVLDAIASSGRVSAREFLESVLAMLKGEAG